MSDKKADSDDPGDPGPGAREAKLLKRMAALAAVMTALEGLSHTETQKVLSMAAAASSLRVIPMDRPVQPIQNRESVKLAQAKKASPKPASQKVKPSWKKAEGAKSLVDKAHALAQQLKAAPKGSKEESDAQVALDDHKKVIGSFQKRINTGSAKPGKARSQAPEKEEEEATAESRSSATLGSESVSSDGGGETSIKSE